jgi:hypothetical protein
MTAWQLLVRPRRGEIVVTKLAPGSFFGRRLRRGVAARSVVLESCYQSEECIPPHEHSAAFFDLVLAGTCSEVAIC